jgi:protein BUR2
MIDEQSTEYWRWRDNIMHHEEVLLEYLTFDLVLESPYHVLFAYLRELGVHKHEKLRNVAWAFINDGNHTTICLSLPSKDIAIAALYFAAQFIQDPLPDDDAGNPWWERLGGTVDKIVKGVKILSAFWRENPLMRQDNPYERSPIYSVEDLNRSRRSADIATPSPMHSQQMARNDSQMSNGAVNGTGEGSQNSRANGRMEKSISSNGVARVEERRDRKLGVQDESIVKAVESSAGTSDKALKEAANDPATHAPEGKFSKHSFE